MVKSEEFTGSILTPSQREFLRHGPGSSQSPASQRMTKSRIRDRLGAAIIDLSTILRSDYLDVEEIESAFTEPLEIDFAPIPAKLLEEAVAMLFIGAMAYDDEFDKEQTTGEVYPNEFFEQVAEGVELGFTRMGRTVIDGDVNMRVELDDIEVERAGSTALHELSVDRLDRLRLAQEIDESEFVEAILRKRSKRNIDETGITGE